MDPALLYQSDQTGKKRKRITEDVRDYAELAELDRWCNIVEELHAWRSTVEEQCRKRNTQILHDLRQATPAVVCKPQSTVEDDICEPLFDLRERLTEGFEDNLVPMQMKDMMDTLLDPMASMDIPHSAWCDDNDQLCSEEYKEALNEQWMELVRIHDNARDCEMYGKDENAWRLEVFQLIMRSAAQGMVELIDV